MSRKRKSRSNSRRSNASIIFKPSRLRERDTERRRRKVALALALIPERRRRRVSHNNPRRDPVLHRMRRTEPRKLRLAPASRGLPTLLRSTAKASFNPRRAHAKRSVTPLLARPRPNRIPERSDAPVGVSRDHLSARRTLAEGSRKRFLDCRRRQDERRFVLFAIGVGGRRASAPGKPGGYQVKC